MSEILSSPNGPQNSGATFVAAFGFVPNLFLAQSESLLAVEAEEWLIDAIVLREGRLSRRQKEAILLRVADARENDYCRALFGRAAQSPSGIDPILLKFSHELAARTFWFSNSHVEELQQTGFDHVAILEAISTVSLGQLLCTLADGLRPALDEGLVLPARKELPPLPEPSNFVANQGPYLGLHARPDANAQPYRFFQEEYGFVPNVCRGLGLRPDLVEAEIEALKRILIPENGLSRIQKEYLFLAVSAANLNTYYVTMRRQILSTLGVSPEESDQIVEDHQESGLPEAEKALLDEARKLASLPARWKGHFDRNRLKTHGFTDSQIIEAVVMSALANYLNTNQVGIGARPDFPPHRIFSEKDLYRQIEFARPKVYVAPPVDPDAETIAQVQNGDVDAFEDLVRRHTRRVTGTLLGMVGNMEDARDATQDVFLKAFENIGRFEGRSKFSTWLISIAINTGTELLRRRKPSEPLELEDDDGFRPRQLQSWLDNPEQLMSAAQRSELVRKAVLRLPDKYRAVVLLRDINQVSTEEAAAALGLGVPALKARLLRGRLMLRESLSPYFIRAGKRSHHA